MAVIATYDARWLEGRFRIELTEDSLRVSGVYALGSRRVESTIPLASLQPRADRLWVRSRVFSVGLWMATIGLVGAWLLTKQFRMSPYEPLPGMALVLGVIGVPVMAITYSRKEFARFVSLAGVPELDVARTGDKAEFEDFIARVSAAIAAAQEKPAAG